MDQRQQQIQAGTEQKNENLKKTKKIAKNKKQRKEEQKYEEKSIEELQLSSGQKRRIKKRKLTGAPLGRRKGQKKSEGYIINPIIDTEFIIKDYFDSIGIKHGIVFKPEVRVKLKREQISMQQNKIMWNDDHEWNKEKQTKKIYNNGQVMSAIRSFVRKSGLFQSEEELIQLFLNLSFIISEQSTNEVYFILAKILESITQEKTDAYDRNLAAEIFQKLRFFSGRFTRLFIRYWIEIIPDEGQIKDLFISMFLELKEELKKVFGKSQTLKEYLKYRSTQDKKLKAIENEPKNTRKC